MATYSDVISGALRRIGALAAGTASANDSATGLLYLNGLFDQWAAERLYIYSITRAVVAAGDRGRYGK